MESQELHEAFNPHSILPNEPELIQCLYESLQHQTGFHDFLAMLTTAINGYAAQLTFVRKAPRSINTSGRQGSLTRF